MNKPRKSEVALIERTPASAPTVASAPVAELSAVDAAARELDAAVQAEAEARQRVRAAEAALAKARADAVRERTEARSKVLAERPDLRHLILDLARAANEADRARVGQGASMDAEPALFNRWRSLCQAGGRLRDADAVGLEKIDPVAERRRLNIAPTPPVPASKPVVPVTQYAQTAGEQLENLNAFVR